MGAPRDFAREQGPGGLEVRTTGAERLVVRAAGGLKKGPGLVGYGSVSGVVSTIEGWFSDWDEEVAPGAWAKTISEGDIRSMFNHNTDRLLGRTKSKTLTLSEDDTGLRYEVSINNADPNAMSVHAQVERGDVDGSSVWFRILREVWTYPDKTNSLERPHRLIQEARLFETGPVVFPAFEQTSVAARTGGPVLDGVLRALGISDPGQRALRASDLLSHSDIEAEIRALLDSAPNLRAAVCACETPDRAAAEAPGHRRDGTPPAGHLPPIEYFTARARATAGRYGLS